MGNERAFDGLEQLGADRCIALLSISPIGRVGFVATGRPQVLPVTFASDRDGVVVFRTTSDSSLASVASTRSYSKSTASMPPRAPGGACAFMASPAR